MNQVLVFFHLLGLVVALGPGLANGPIMMRARSASPESAAALRSLPPILSRISAVGLALLIITGPILLATKYAGHAPSATAFGIKMAFVVAIVLVFGWMQVTMMQIRKTGNVALARRVGLLGPLLGLLGLGTMIFAVAAFAAG